MSHVLGVHHTGITVSDLAESVDFYERFGFLVEERIESIGPDVGEGTGVPDAHLRVAMMVRGVTRIELLEYVKPEGVQNPAIPNNGIGAAHIAIEVADVDAVVAELIDDGFQAYSDPITHESGLRWVYFRGPDGTTTELFQTAR